MDTRTTLLEGNGERRLQYKVISNDGGSKGAGGESPTGAIVISDMDAGGKEAVVFEFTGDGPVTIETIISDRVPAEPPSKGQYRDEPGPGFALVASGAGNLKKVAANVLTGKVIFVCNFISHNGSA